jgi:hypothetical protein
MDRLELPGWIIEYDPAATVAAYASARVEPRSPCACDPCQNWMTTRDRLYAGEFQELLDRLGIAADLEAEVYHISKLDEEVPGRHLYAGWYPLVGRILNGERECSGDVQLGFSQLFFHSAPGPLMPKAFDHLHPLIQLEFTATVPWLSHLPEEGSPVT